MVSGDDAYPCGQSLYVYDGYQMLEIVPVGMNVMPWGDDGVWNEEHSLALGLADQNPEQIFFLSSFTVDSVVQ